jgi:hypothetical protein
VSSFFKGLMGYYDIEYLNLNPNVIFHTAVFLLRGVGCDAPGF